MSMAQRTHTLLADHVDGSQATETLRFALDGVEYEIDLNERHARELREAVSLFVDAARRGGGGPSRAGARGAGFAGARRGRRRGRRVPPRRGAPPTAPGRSGSGPGRTATA